MRNRDRANPVVALADALREVHPSMFGGGAAASVDEADRLYKRAAERLINLGIRLGSEAEASGAGGALSGGGGIDTISLPSGRPPGWRLVIERAWNGYAITDTTRTGGWLVAGEDPLEAAAELLDALNQRLGADGRPEDERRVVVTLEAGDAWLAAHPAGCPHDNVRNLDYLEDPDREGWACACGVLFAPVDTSERATQR